MDVTQWRRTSNVGSVVEFSPATREARVRFPDVADFLFYIKLLSNGEVPSLFAVKIWISGKILFVIGLFCLNISCFISWTAHWKTDHFTGFIDQRRSWCWNLLLRICSHFDKLNRIGSSCSWGIWKNIYSQVKNFNVTLFCICSIPSWSASGENFMMRDC